MIPGLILQTFGSAFAIGLFAANLAIGFGVYQDAHRLLRTVEGGPRISPPGAWGLICLFTSVPGLAVYWAAHHSTLAK